MDSILVAIETLVIVTIELEYCCKHWKKSGDIIYLVLSRLAMVDSTKVLCTLEEIGKNLFVSKIESKPNDSSSNRCMEKRR